MNKKYIYIIAPAIVAVAAGIIAVGTVSAASQTGTQNPMTNLVNAIAQRFNVNPTDVQKVFDDQKSAMRATMEQKFADKLAQLVASGKLTQAQADKITAKKAELEAGQAAFEASLQGKTKAEVRAAIKAQMDSLKQWATDNNIPLQYLMPFGGRKMMGPRGFGGMMHP